MSTRLMTGSAFVALLLSHPVLGQNYFLDEPKRGGFKIRPSETMDVTNVMHFTGSGMGALVAHRLFEKLEWPHPDLWAGGVIVALGLMKEWQDGYREGLSIYDIIANHVGILTFLAAKRHLNFRLVPEKTFGYTDGHGLGLRFLRSSGLTPVQMSFGTFMLLPSGKPLEFGVDVHLPMGWRFEWHLGLSMFSFANLQRFALRPHTGIAVELF